jgi:hypothetical protein
MMTFQLCIARHQGQYWSRRNGKVAKDETQIETYKYQVPPFLMSHGKRLNLNKPHWHKAPTGRHIDEATYHAGIRVPEGLIDGMVVVYCEPHKRSEIIMSEESPKW